MYVIVFVPLTVRIRLRRSIQKEVLIVYDKPPSSQVLDALLGWVLARDIFMGWTYKARHGHGRAIQVLESRSGPGEPCIILFLFGLLG